MRFSEHIQCTLQWWFQNIGTITYHWHSYGSRIVGHYKGRCAVEFIWIRGVWLPSPRNFWVIFESANTVACFKANYNYVILCKRLITTMLTHYVDTHLHTPIPVQNLISYQVCRNHDALDQIGGRATLLPSQRYADGTAISSIAMKTAPWKKWASKSQHLKVWCLVHFPWSNTTTPPPHFSAVLWWISQPVPMQIGGWGRAPPLPWLSQCFSQKMKSWSAQYLRV